MSRLTKFSAIALLAFLSIVPAASAHEHGSVVVGGGFVSYGPGWGWYGPAWYGPGWYSPYAWGWGYPGYAYAYGPAEYTGGVKIVNTAKDSLVYVDGGYAGTVRKLKRFSLKPGNHNIEFRDPSGHTYHQERIHVIPGKTLEVSGRAAGGR
jgi:hypothetical protein